MQPAQWNKIQWFIAIYCAVVLAAATIALYWPITHDAFINFDDNAYVTDNPHVKAGLTWTGIVWAFTSGYAANWHPLTWISHMVDYQLFGLNAGDHHMMNIFFHTANTVLLFILLTYMTGAMWRSAFVAALFAWHPLHVESVAWASERKDVLSAFFWMLTLLCYALYVKGKRKSPTPSFWSFPPPAAPKPSSAESSLSSATLMPGKVGVKTPRWDPSVPTETVAPKPRFNPEFKVPAAPAPESTHIATPPIPVPHSFHFATSPFYWLAIFSFALGLMSKPMVVTLPFVLLLLDFWPFNRFGHSAFHILNQIKTPNLKLKVCRLIISHHSSLLLEKVPFLALSFAACAVTYLVQKHGGAVVVNDPFSIRASNAFWAYERYIAKTFWPTNLSIVYPYVRNGLAFAGIVSALLLVVCSIAIISLARRWPYLFTGWFWFLGTLVPVIGFVEIGPASMADRYTYIPDIGLFILVTWAVVGLFESRRQVLIPAAAGIAALAACVYLTSLQISYWHNSITLFEHAIQVTSDNAVANACVGQALDVDGSDPEALKYCQEAVQIDPQYPAGQFFLGQVLWKLGHPDEAFTHLNLAAKSAPDNSGFQYNLGKFLFEHGKVDEAIVRFSAALKDDPDFAEAHNALGKAFLQQGKLQSAAEELAQAVSLDPDNAQFRYDLGTVLLNASQPAQAIAQFSEAIRIQPDYALAHENLAVALAGQGKLADAIAEFDKVVQLQPNDPEAHSNLGLAYLNDHQASEASAQFQEELRLTPNEPKAHYHLAQALRDQKELSQAAKEYREALRLAPGFADAKKELDEILAAHPQLNN